MTTPLPESPLDAKGIEKLDKRVGGLRQINMDLQQELAKSGAGVDVSTARVEKVMEFLTDQGFITQEQRLREQETWELHLRENLKALVEQVREVRRAQGVDVQRNSGLIIPGHHGQA